MVKRKRLGLLCTWIYVFLIFVTSDNITLLISSFILFIGFIITCTRRDLKRKIRWDSYYSLQIFFIAYCIIQIVLGIAVLKNVSWSMARRLTINCIDEVVLFNILIEQDDIEDFFKTIIYPFTAGVLLIALLQFKSGTLFSLRLSSDLGEDMQYRFLGLTIHAGVATIVGHCTVCAFVFSLIAYYFFNKKKYVVISVICFAALALTVSRKALAVAVVMYILVPELRVHNRKRLIKIMESLSIIFIAILLIMKIPALYNMIGSRFIRMFESLTGEQTVDSSMRIRNNIKAMAWTEFLKRPMEGWGVNSFKDLFNNGWIYSHNNYLELLVGTGILGTVLFFSKYILLFVKGYKIRANEKRSTNGMTFISTSLMIWLVMAWIMEYWQVAYYNERMIVHYTVILAIFVHIMDNRTNIGEHHD